MPFLEKATHKMACFHENGEKFRPAKTDALLRIRYKGDVARVRIGDKLVMDDFYNGLPLEIGLKRYAEEIKKAEVITLEILPFRADAPVFLLAACRT